MYGRTLACLVMGTMLLGAAGACGIEGPRDRDDSEEERRPEAIIGGSEAVAYPEAALIDMMINGSIASACSGAVIAPRVVLTAGHCVAGFNGWKVTAPYVGQSATSNEAYAYDWTDTSGTVNPNQHDVAVIILPTAITLDQYPIIAADPIPFGDKVVNVGRINNGQFSNSKLFVSQPVTVYDGKDYGYPLDYVATEVIQPGDSGGPDLLPGPLPHTIVAVNSGGGGGTELLARVDLLYSWIQDQIANNGGGGNTDPNPDPDPGPDPDPDPGPDPEPDPEPGDCAHDVCVEAGPLQNGCSPCVSAVCQADPYCCTTAWDLKCLAEVGDYCGQNCWDNGPTDPPPGGGGNDPDPCGGLTYSGECQGGEVWWCENNQIYVWDCASGGMSCVWSSGNGYYTCGY